MPVSSPWLVNEEWALGARYEATYVVSAAIVTGAANGTVCQPDADSPLNVPCARSRPSADHSAPTCVPVFADALKKRMPVTVPAASAVNLTPRSTELVSPESTTAGVFSSKIDACGVTLSEAVEAAPVPATFLAATVNV